MRANIELSATRTRIDTFTRPNSTSAARSGRHVIALACLFVGIAVVRPSTVQGQSQQLTPIELALPIAVAEAYDAGGSTHLPVLAYDDWSDVLNAYIDARAEDGNGSAEAAVGLTEWAKTFAGPSAVAASSYFVELEVEDPQGRPQVKTILSFKGAVGTYGLGAGASLMIVLGRSNNVPPLAWVRDDLTVQRLDLPFPDNGIPVFRMDMNTTYAPLPDGTSTPAVVSHIMLNGVYPGIQKMCHCTSMSDGGALNLTFAPGRYLLVVLVGAAGAQEGGALAVADPVLTAHPDNPDVIVTRLAPVGTIGRGPLSDTTPEELAALGLDPAPFSEMGFFDPPSDPPSDPPADTSAPTTVAATSAMPNASGWHRGNVTVNLAATDNADGSGVQEIHVALTGASTGTHVVPGANAAASISAEGETMVTYYAVDEAGNQEAPKTLTIKVDATPPLLAGLPAAGCSIWPPDHRLVSVAAVSASDALSGLAPGATTISVTSNEPALGLGEGDAAPDVVITDGVVEVRAERAGSGSGRIYTITASASDLAGNTASASAICTVPHDEGFTPER